MELLISATWLPWVGFNAFVLAVLALDLFLFNRKNHEVKVGEALRFVLLYMALALIFCLGVWEFRGAQSATEFLTGYLVELSLSADNLFVFLLIFTFFEVPPKYQHKILFWGILGAVFMRAGFIFAGVALLESFHWIMYIFGAILIISGIKILRRKEDDKFDPERNFGLKIFRYFFEVSDRYNGGDFFVRQAGKWVATPLFVVLITVETTDLVFAVDSIPAVLAITRDPFIVYTSNIFAILGLRSLYFALAAMARLFVYLKYGLALILVFIGTQMIIEPWFDLPTLASLAVTMTLLFGSIALSLMHRIGPIRQ